MAAAVAALESEGEGFFGEDEAIFEAALMEVDVV